MKTTAQSRCVLALDQGSQSSRAIVYSASGHAMAKTQIPVTSRRYGTACVEQNPDEYWHRYLLQSPA